MNGMAESLDRNILKHTAEVSIAAQRIYGGS